MRHARARLFACACCFEFDIRWNDSLSFSHERCEDGSLRVPGATGLSQSEGELPQVTYKIKITPKLVYSILWPFIYGKFREQIKAVLPISAFLFIFQLALLRTGVADALGISLGLFIVILGLMFFMEGLRLGLMPLGENIGATLPEKARLWLILGFAVILGISVTMAEPAIPTLQQAGVNIQPSFAPVLSQMLKGSSTLLVAAVALGVGIAAALGIYRFVRNWSLKVLLIPSLLICLGLTAVLQLTPETRRLIALAWDTGAVTTGPVTVPLVLALGLGVSAVLGKSDTGMSGFGIVTLASLWPVTMVALLGLFLYVTGAYGGPDVALAAGEVSYVILLRDSIIGAVRAIVPLVILLVIVQRFVLREPIRNTDQIIAGVVLAVLGMLLFFIGLSSGLTALGGQVGGNVPQAFSDPRNLYGETVGRIVGILFAFVLGYGATMAEPALNALGMTVEEVTAGAFKKALLIQAVAFGVGLGLAVGIAKVMFDLPMVYLIIPPYLVLIGITLISDEKYVNIGWDSAGVTTGPITVPLVLAMGLGIGGAVGVPDGFGMLAMASIGPILSVLLMGLYIAKFGKVGEAPKLWIPLEEEANQLEQEAEPA